MYIRITLLCAKYGYYVSNKDFFVECEKEENMEVTEADATSNLKRRF